MRVLSMFVASVCFASAALSSGGAQTAPNFVVIMTDDQTFESV
jgi:hypothetical protein